MSKLKYKKHILHAVFVFMGVGWLHAQQIVPASGGDAVGSGGSSSYTVGQVVYTTNTGVNGSVAQGIQQPYEISTLVGLEVTQINLELSAYPNPTNNVIHLSIGNYENGLFCCQYSISNEPQVNPAPKAAIQTVSPLLTAPVSIASEKAMAIDAAVVFPYFSILLNTWSSLSFIRF